MCGIVGIISRKTEHLDLGAELTAMMEAQVHRGPDDNGKVFWNWDGNVSDECSDSNKYDGAWGFNRLSIRDVSNNGHQPMFNSDGSVVICFNGEIYNTDYLKTIIKHHDFKSTSDTEVVLALYEELGIDDAIKLLNGMFSIVITDYNKRKIYISRDRMGIKPLYYYKNDGFFLVSSEVKSIVKSGKYEVKPDLDSLYEYFIFRNITQNRSLFEGVYSFEPGVIYCIDSEGECTTNRYFRLNDYNRDETISYREYKNGLNKLITDAVSRQLVSDVSLGTQLSGGIDSSLVAKKMACQHKSNSISIVFSEKDFTEEKYIEIVSKKLGIESNKIPFGIEDFLKYYEKTIWHMECMLPHSNCMGLYKLCKEAKKIDTVLLSGEGADELFGGYQQFSNIFTKSINKENEDYDDYMISYAYGGNKNEIIKIMNNVDRFQEFIDIRKKIIDKFDGNIVDKQIKYELSTYLPELLIRQDKMSMASSVENRVPLLDNEVIDYALNGPVKYLFAKRGLLKPRYEGKYVLKDMVADYFGKKFAYRPKMGFAMPLNTFLSNEKFYQYYKKTLKPRLLEREYIDGDYIDSCMERLKKGENVNVDLVWRALSFEVWCQLFIDGRLPQEI